MGASQTLGLVPYSLASVARKSLPLPRSRWFHQASVLDFEKRCRWATHRCCLLSVCLPVSPSPLQPRPHIRYLLSALLLLFPKHGQGVGTACSLTRLFPRRPRCCHVRMEEQRPLLPPCLSLSVGCVADIYIHPR